MEKNREAISNRAFFSILKRPPKFASLAGSKIESKTRGAEYSCSSNARRERKGEKRRARGSTKRGRASKFSMLSFSTKRREGSEIRFPSLSSLSPFSLRFSFSLSLPFLRLLQRKYRNGIVTAEGIAGEEEARRRKEPQEKENGRGDGRNRIDPTLFRKKNSPKAQLPLPGSPSRAGSSTWPKR